MRHNTCQRAHLMTRRNFLAGACGAISTLSACQYADPSAEFYEPLKNAGKSAIKHIIVLMMENRSFDHYLGWLPGADNVAFDVSGTFPADGIPATLVRGFFNLTDNPDSVMVLREDKDDPSTETRIPLPEAGRELRLRVRLETLLAAVLALWAAHALT